MKKILTFLLAAMTLTTALISIPAPAQAAGAEIEREIFLAGSAGEYGGTARILQYDRRINLAADEYLWTHELDPLVRQRYYKDRTITLAAGYYNWNCIVYPDSVDFYAYRTYCSLRREATGSVAYISDMLVRPGTDYNQNGILGTNYFWESTLTRI